MMGGRTKIGIGRTTRVKAVSMIAWGQRTLCTCFISNTEFIYLFFRKSDGVWISNENHACKNERALTCLAAILEDPTTFPLLSSTSMPSDSSLCLIRPTLQMFALAGKGEGDSSEIIMHFNQNLCSD